MYDCRNPELYHFRRAHQEQVAAINARSPAAASAHRRLAALHATKACLLMADEGTVHPAAVQRRQVALQLLFRAAMVGGAEARSYAAVG
jgi:hypothetical protein